MGAVEWTFMRRISAPRCPPILLRPVGGAQSLIYALAVLTELPK